MQASTFWSSPLFPHFDPVAALLSYLPSCRTLPSVTPGRRGALLHAIRCYYMQASMLEIYNEEYRDLLAKRPKAAPGGNSQSQTDAKKHTVRLGLREKGGEGAG